ncbi:hypothetical protein MPLDJ20_110344 [Mesorhizobium plurifarium]|uniref:Uncharacterized protein n=1 Tax=Mesorhizobium plurifarium TaxID=69974 RepID=A0A090DV36_MESPL|nr:hypothetical protein MPLDJ20_110344 [Mesorhizobium plurifarium]
MAFVPPSLAQPPLRRGFAAPPLPRLWRGRGKGRLEKSSPPLSESSPSARPWGIDRFNHPEGNSWKTLNRPGRPSPFSSPA